MGSVVLNKYLLDGVAGKAAGVGRSKPRFPRLT